MIQGCETRAIEAKASRDSCGVCVREFPSPYALNWQFPSTSHHFRPEMAATIAAPARESLQPRFSELGVMGLVEATE